MIHDSLIQAMPDLVAFVSADGLITHHLGGRQVPFIRDAGSLAGRRLEDVLQPDVSALIARLVRRALAGRTTCEAKFSDHGASYLARISAQGPRRALCIVRHLVDGQPEAGPDAMLEGSERRSFLRRLEDSVADAVLRERPLAVCLIFLGGLADIGQLIDFSIGELILAEVMRKLPASDARPDGVTWYVGQLGESVLGAVIRGDVDRDAIRGIAGLLCAAIAHPIDLRDATFRLAPAVGVAVLGQDASQPAALLDHARSAMLESRRAGAGAVQFYSDTLHMLPVARLDIARELRAAIGEGQIGLRYAARHDLSNGRIAAIQSYMHWEHPLQGEVPAAQFIPIADATGLAVAISRAALERLAHDLDALTARFGRDVPVSFGALRQHVTSGHLLRDCSRLLPSGETKCGRFQLRISERSMATLSRPERVLGELTECGHRVVIDEMGRGLSSLARLPQWPVWALQIDRALVKAAGRNAAALRSCRGITALAHALEVATIAAGIDDESTRARMLGIGCLEGLGDHYPAVAPLARVPAEARATR